MLALIICSARYKYPFLHETQGYAKGASLLSCDRFSSDTTLGRECCLLGLKSRMERRLILSLVSFTVCLQGHSPRGSHFMRTLSYYDMVASSRDVGNTVIRLLALPPPAPALILLLQRSTVPFFWSPTPSIFPTHPRPPTHFSTKCPHLRQHPCLLTSQERVSAFHHLSHRHLASLGLRIRPELHSIAAAAASPPLHDS